MSELINKNSSFKALPPFLSLALGLICQLLVLYALGLWFAETQTRLKKIILVNVLTEKVPKVLKKPAQPNHAVEIAKPKPLPETTKKVFPPQKKETLVSEKPELKTETIIEPPKVKIPQKTPYKAEKKKETIRKTIIRPKEKKKEIFTIPKTRPNSVKVVKKVLMPEKSLPSLINKSGEAAKISAPPQSGISQAPPEPVDKQTENPGSSENLSLNTPTPLEQSVISAYLNRVRKMLVKQQRYPSAARRRNITGIVNVSFQIKQDGSISGVRVAPGSNKILRKAAQSLVERTNPPAPPENWPESLIIEIPLRYNLR